MILLQYLLPHHLLNKLARFLGNCSIGWVKRLLINYFLHKYKINLQEAINSDPSSYKNYNDFFTRKLRPGVRNIDSTPHTIVSPCDGYITQYGDLTPELLIEAKGKQLSLNGILATTHPRITEIIDWRNFIGGKFVNIYLAPHNYHRIHMPITATLTDMIYIPGRLFSVNPKFIPKIPKVFTLNQRILNIFDSPEAGKVVVILVGAMIVGSIVTTWHGEVTPSKSNQVKLWNYKDKKINLSRGEELGYFQLGSTVILLCDNKNLHFTTNIQINTSIHLGNKILQVF